MQRDPLEFLAAFLPGTERALTRTGVQVHCLNYWHEALDPWVGQGKRVLVTWDPRDIYCAYVRTPGGVLVKAVLTTPDIPRMSLPEWEARRRWERTLAKDPMVQREADQSLLRSHSHVQDAKRSRRIQRRRATAAAGDRYTHSAQAAPDPTPSTPAEPLHSWITESSELFYVEEITYDF